MTNRKTQLWCICTICLIGAAAALAGSAYRITCQNKQCAHTESVNFGGGRASEMVTGYCVNCQAFVYVSWKRTDQGKASTQPAMAGKVWMSETGQTGELFNCPKCTKPFLAIHSAGDLKACPKCGQTDLTRKTTRMYD